MKLSALIPTTGEFDQIVLHARLADELGFESINCSHISARDSFTTLAALAAAAPRVQLGTAVAPIYHRAADRETARRDARVRVGDTRAPGW